MKHVKMSDVAGAIAISRHMIQMQPLHVFYSEEVQDYKYNFG